MSSGLSYAPPRRIYVPIPPQLLGILLTLIAVAAAFVTGLLVKAISGELPVLTMLMFRFLFSLPILFCVALMMRGRSIFHLTETKPMLVRICFGLSGITLWFLSVKSIPLGQATALFQSSVLFVTLMSPFLLGEKIGPYRGFAVIAGLLGIVVITEPLSDSLSFGILFGIGAALAGAGLSIILRKLGKKEHPATVAVLYNGSAFLIVSLVLLGFPAQFEMPAFREMMFLLALGVVSSLLQICMTFSYRYCDAVIIATLRYLQVPLAGLGGYFIFSEWLTTAQITGAAIVVSSCLFIVWREFAISRQAQK